MSPRDLIAELAEVSAQEVRAGLLRVTWHFRDGYGLTLDLERTAGGWVWRRRPPAEGAGA